VNTLASRYNMGEGGLSEDAGAGEVQPDHTVVEERAVCRDAREANHSAEARRTDCALFQPISNYYQRRTLLRLESCTQLDLRRLGADTQNMSILFSHKRQLCLRSGLR
jgi:hypothetical protein